MTTVEEYIYMLEANRIIQGFAKTTGKPTEHIEGVWKDTEKEVIAKHKFGVTDKYKEIGGLVKAKLGLKSDAETKHIETKSKEAAENTRPDTSKEKQDGKIRPRVKEGDLNSSEKKDREDYKELKTARKGATGAAEKKEVEDQKKIG